MLGVCVVVGEGPWYWVRCPWVSACSARVLLRVPPKGPELCGELSWETLGRNSPYRCVMTWQQDFRFAWRTLFKSPALLVVATLSLGLGIALNTTIFSLVYAALFRTPEVSRPSELVNVYSLEAGTDDVNPQSVPDFLDLAAATTSFTDLIGHSLAIMNVQVGTRPTPVLGGLVTHDYFEVLGVRAREGRTFVESEGLGSSAPPSVVLTDAYWQRDFGGGLGALEQSLRIGGVDFEIVGVLPVGFKGLTRGLQPELFVPLAQVDHVEPMGEIVAEGRSEGLGTLEWRGYRFLTVVGRLAPGVDLNSAEAEFDTLTASLANDYPVSNQGRTARLLPTSKVRIDPDFDGVVVPGAMIVLGLVGMVLLVACANVGNMLLARAEGRRREIALRLALGAKRSQLIRLLLMESVLLALLAGAAGLTLAAGATRLLSQLRFDLPVQITLDPGLDAPVLLFTLFISLATGIVFGLIPAVQTVSPDLVPALKAESSVVTRRGLLRRWFQPARALVVLQVALSLVLLVGAGLLQRSVALARAVDLGFDADRFGVLNLDLSSMDLEGEALAARWAEMIALVESQPGVEQASVATRTPLDMNMHTGNFLIPGHRDSENDPPLTLDLTEVGNDYFETLGIGLEDGSWFPNRTPPSVTSSVEFGVERETGENPPPEATLAIVNRAMAARFWPGESSVGKSFRIGTLESPPVTIVGVVSDYKVRTPGERPRPMVHLSRRSAGGPYGNLIYRTTAPAAAAEAAVNEAVLARFPDAFLLESTSLSRRRDFVLLPIRLGGVLVSGLSALALLLAVVGLAGLVAYWVSQRTREIGIRVALGADQARITRLVMGRSLSLVAVGCVLGLVGSLVLGKLLQTVLYVPATDPRSLVGGMAILLTAAAAATMLPVRRASRIDPLKALRTE